MKVGDREYCLAQRLVTKLGERQNLQKIAASTLRSALTTVAGLERQLEEAWNALENVEMGIELARENLRSSKLNELARNLSVVNMQVKHALRAAEEKQ